MSLFDDMSKEIAEANLQRIQTCAEVVENVTESIEPLTDPEDKADLILAVEDLLIEATKLYKKAYEMVWNAPFSEEIPRES
jgi:sulfite reductase beta subunit-like hemoprotein